MESTAAIAFAPATPLIPLIKMPALTESASLTTTRFVETVAVSPNPNEITELSTAVTVPLSVSVVPAMLVTVTPASTLLIDTDAFARRPL